jgi:hypothetical protein
MAWTGRRFALAVLAGSAVLASDRDLAAQTVLSGEPLHLVRLPRAVTINSRRRSGAFER